MGKKNRQEKQQQRMHTHTMTPNQTESRHVSPCKGLSGPLCLGVLQNYEAIMVDHN